jgi:uncharacterized protein YceK
MRLIIILFIMTSLLSGCDKIFTEPQEDLRAELDSYKSIIEAERATNEASIASLDSRITALEAELKSISDKSKTVDSQWIMWQKIQNLWSKYAVLGIKDKPVDSHDSKRECLEAASKYAEANNADGGSLSFTIKSDVRVDRYTLTCLPIHVNPNQ